MPLSWRGGWGSVCREPTQALICLWQMRACPIVLFLRTYGPIVLRTLLLLFPEDLSAVLPMGLGMAVFLDWPVRNVGPQHHREYATIEL